jgi:hypothetical protein
VVGLSAAGIGAWFKLSPSILFGFKGRFFSRPESLLLGPCVILAVESANFGAMLGEVSVGVYGRQRLSHQLAK